LTDITIEGHPWLLIHTNPKQEERTTTNLQAWNVETFSPRIKEIRYNQFTGAPTCTVKPLFARYIFARFDVERLFHKVRFTRGVHDLVAFGNGPVEVDNAIIDLIRSRIDEDGFVKIGTDLTPGDTVVVMAGALKDFTGVFERALKDSDRVVVLLNTVNYQARLQIDRDLVQRHDPSPCPA
jgi:transcriptional antiterminator RfaH